MLRVRGDFPSVLKNGRLACLLAERSYGQDYSHHYYQRRLKYIAQIASQLERNYVSLSESAMFNEYLYANTDDVHRSAARPTTRVNEEWLFLLILVQNDFEIPMRECDLPSQKPMRFLASDSLEPLK